MRPSAQPRVVRAVIGECSTIVLLLLGSVYVFVTVKREANSSNRQQVWLTEM
jgi:hypothetical protein